MFLFLLYCYIVIFPVSKSIAGKEYYRDKLTIESNIYYSIVTLSIMNKIMSR